MNKNKLMNHLKKAVSSMESRPILQCVLYSKDGNIYATDSHVAIKVNEFHSSQDDILLNLFTMELKEDGTYPDLAKLMEISDMKCEINVNIAMLIKAVKPFLDKSLFVDTVTMEIKNNKMTLQNKGYGEFLVEVPLHDCEGEITISAGAGNLLKALEFMRDAKSTEKHNDGLANIKFQGPIRPFKFTTGKYEYLVTPVRTF